MARGVKGSRSAKAASTAAPAPVTRKRLTTEQKAAIAEGLAKGEKGATLAAQFNVSLATIYQQKKKMGTTAASNASAAAGVLAPPEAVDPVGQPQAAGSSR